MGTLHTMLLPALNSCFPVCFERDKRRKGDHPFLLFAYPVSNLGLRSIDVRRLFYFFFLLYVRIFREGKRV